MYTVDVQTAMRWTCEKWEWCPSIVIEMCVDHCLKKGVEVGESERGTNKEEAVVSMERDTTENGVQFTRVCLDSLLCPAEKDAVTESVAVQLVANSFAGVADESDSEEVNDYSDEGDHCLSTDKKLGFLAQARAIIERNRDLCESGIKHLKSVNAVFGFTKLLI